MRAHTAHRNLYVLSMILLTLRCPWDDSAQLIHLTYSMSGGLVGQLSTCTGLWGPFSSFFCLSLRGPTLTSCGYRRNLIPGKWFPSSITVVCLHPHALVNCDLEVAGAALELRQMHLQHSASPHATHRLFIVDGSLDSAVETCVMLLCCS